MSRRFWLPTRKGVELSPGAIQAPTKLVVQGAPPGTLLHDMAVARFGGRLKQFHGKQQQAYSLSEIPIQRGQIEWEDGRARYTNLSGHETLELQVRNNALKEIRKEVAKRLNLPRWLLVEVRVPAAYMQGYMLAKIVQGQVPGAVWPMVLPQANTTSVFNDDNTYSSNPFYWFDFAYGSSATEVEQGQWIGSLLVDLEPFWGFPTIGVELYGHGRGYPSYEDRILGYAFYAQHETIALTVGGPWIGVVGNPGFVGLGADFGSLPGSPTLTGAEFIRRHPETAGMVFAFDWSGPGGLLTESYWDPVSEAFLNTGNTYATDPILGIISSSLIDDYYSELVEVINLGTFASPAHVALLEQGIAPEDWDGFNYFTDDGLGITLETGYNRWQFVSGREIPYGGAGSVPFEVIHADDFESPSFGPVTVPEFPFLGVVTVDMERWGYSLIAPQE